MVDGEKRRTVAEASSGGSFLRRLAPVADARVLTFRPARIFLFILALLAPTCAGAQAYGQWSWDALVSIGQFSNSAVGGTLATGSRQSNLRLRFGLDGFVLHPAIGSFGLDFDLGQTRWVRDAGFESQLLGYGFSLNMFPRGKVPFRFFARQGLFDQSTSTGVPLELLRRVPDSSTALGGGLRVARGGLRGLQLGFERNELEFLGSGVENDVFSRSYLSWGRRTGPLQQRLRLRRHARSLGFLEQELANLVVNYTQSAQLAPRWSWRFNLDGAENDVSRASAREYTTGRYSVRTLLQHNPRPMDVLVIKADSLRNTSTLRPDSDTHRISLSYLWRTRPSWSVAPSVSYTTRTFGDTVSDAAQVGVGANWNRRFLRSLDTRLGAGVGLTDFRATTPTLTQDQNATTYTASAMLGHGAAVGLRKELELTASRNDVEFEVDPIDEIEVGGFVRETRLGDSQRARFTLRHAWDSTSINGWAEWRAVESSARVPLEETYSSESLRGSLEYNSIAWSVAAQVGSDEILASASPRQEVSYWTASAQWRPWRRIRVHSLYRATRRRVLLLSDIDFKRLEAGVTLRLGLLDVTASAWRAEDSFEGVAQSRHGYRWFISRRFGGFLPVYSVPQRRGTIR